MQDTRSPFTFLLLVLALCLQLTAAVNPLVDLGYTKLRGVAESGGATRWLGVRYAAPPLGRLRFAAPQDPPSTTGTLDVSKFKPICLARQPSDFTNRPGQRFTVDEDCLYLNIFAPSNATSLPVMYFIQGGGFQSNSNANFNGSQLAVFGNIVVVQINYRVGPYGFLQSKEVMSGGALNAGLKDQIQGLKWVQKYIAMFGGDATKVVVAGDSAGATSIALLLAAFGASNPNLFRGAIMESTSVATIRTMDQGQQQYACLVNATGCSTSTDTLTCLRRANATALQTERCQFNPHLDNDLIKEPMLSAFAAGRFLKVPTIAGTCTDEGTKNVPQDTNTTDQALQFVNGQASGVLSQDSLDLVKQQYLDAREPTFPSSGPLWRQLANAHGDFRANCITAALQDAIAVTGGKTWNYRYGVLDQEQERLGFGAYHVVELNGVFGGENTDGFPPKSYLRGAENAGIVPVTMAYWASFVRTLDPNADAAAILGGRSAAGSTTGVPEWKAWTTRGMERLLIQTNNTVMESMGDDQAGNCDMFAPMLPAIESIEPQGTVVSLNQPGQAHGGGDFDGGGGGTPFDQGLPTGDAGGRVFGAEATAARWAAIWTVLVAGALLILIL